MDEKQLHRNLMRMTVLVVLVSIFIAVIGTCSNMYLKKAQKKTTESELIASTEAYKMQIQRQITSNLKTLHTLASFTKVDNFQDKSYFLEGFQQSNQNNDFVSMYLVQEGDQIFESTVNETKVFMIETKDLKEEAREIVKESWQGKEGVSDVFYDENTKKRVMALSVPVYEGKKIEGVLMVYDSLDEFQGILELASQSNKNGKLIIHMINQNGEFLLRSDKRILDEDVSSIYEMKETILEEATIKKILQNKEQYYSSFKIDRKEYNIFFAPLEYHNWYLICILPTVGTTNSVVAMLTVTRIMYTIVLLLSISLIFYGYRIFHKNNTILMKLAYIDPLTETYNAIKFRRVCERVLQKEGQYQICVLNIRKFQFINEILGEKDADVLLCSLAKIIEKEKKKGEYFCHENADQFLFLLKNRKQDEIVELIQRIETELIQFANQYNQTYDIALYTGISNIEEEKYKEVYNRLLQNALVALKAARNSSTNLVFYDEKLYQEMLLKSKIESRMKKALQQEEFKVYLQPKMDLKTGKLAGAEALVRWIQQDGTMVFPDQFIPLFEQNGFCVELDLYMLERVCQKLGKWMDQGKEIVPISINQSKLLFYRNDYIQRICAITEKYQIAPSFIMLEILEGLDIDNIELLNETIQQLHEKGFTISLDDFGSGYSSLNFLGKIQIDELKIDRMFLLGIDEAAEEEKERQKKIMSHIIALAKSMQINTVIEGVETKENEQLMKEMECDLGQGYYYCRPIPVDDFERKYL